MKEFFDKENIEFYFVHKYSSLRIISERIERCIPFTPRSAVIYLIPYFAERGKNISSYAVPRDYHIYIKKTNESLISHLEKKYPNAHFAGFGDRSPIDERHAAATGGLGILGKNGLLINPKYGSYVFIAEVLCDIELPESLAGAEPKYCIDCGKCAEACPSGSLSECTECLSSITQRKGELSENEINLMRKFNTVWGCDECQRVCPYNKPHALTPISFFRENIITELTQEKLDAMDDSAFSERAYSWRGRKTIQRNLEYIKK